MRKRPTKDKYLKKLVMIAEAQPEFKAVPEDKFHVFGQFTSERGTLLRLERPGDSEHDASRGATRSTDEHSLLLLKNAVVFGSGREVATLRLGADGGWHYPPPPDYPEYQGVTSLHGEAGDYLHLRDGACIGEIPDGLRWKYGLLRELAIAGWWNPVIEWIHDLQVMREFVTQKGLASPHHRNCFAGYYHEFTIAVRNASPDEAGYEIYISSGGSGDAPAGTDVCGGAVTWPLLSGALGEVRAWAADGP